MKVVLLSYTNDAERLCAAAARSCYSPDPASEILEDVGEGMAGTFIDKVVGMGHHSVIEHASYTFSLEGVSRSLTHQLVRHRIASYSQQSQRYVSLLEPDYVTPETVRSDPEAKKVFEEAMEKAWEAYQKLATVVPVEDARYVLPNACTTKEGAAGDTHRRRADVEGSKESVPDDIQGRWPCLPPGEVPGREAELWQAAHGAKIYITPILWPHLPGKIAMGNIRPTYIKRVAVELVEKYPRAFSADFENNKILVQRLTNVSSIMMRNRIAGYVSRYWQNKDF